MYKVMCKYEIYYQFQKQLREIQINKYYHEQRLMQNQEWYSDTHDYLSEKLIVIYAIL